MTQNKYEEIARSLARQLARVSAWRLVRNGRGLTQEEYDEAPKDGGTSMRYLGTFADRDAVPPEATHLAKVKLLAPGKANDGRTIAVYAAGVAD